MRKIILLITENIIKSFNLSEDFINDWKEVIDLSLQSKQLGKEIKRFETEINKYKK